MSGVSSISQNSPLQPQASAIEPGNGFLLANAAAIGPTLPMDAQLLQVLQRAFPTGSVQGAMGAASPTALAAFKVMLGAAAGASVSSMADWMVGRMTGQIPAGISALDMQLAGPLIEQTGLAAADVAAWSDAQKVYFIRSLSALSQAKIYDGLPADRAAGLANSILELTRNNDLTIPQAPVAPATTTGTTVRQLPQLTLPTEGAPPAQAPVNNFPVDYGNYDPSRNPDALPVFPNAFPSAEGEVPDTPPDTVERDPQAWPGSQEQAGPLVPPRNSSPTPPEPEPEEPRPPVTPFDAEALGWKERDPSGAMFDLDQLRSGGETLNVGASGGGGAGMTVPANGISDAVIQGVNNFLANPVTPSVAGEGLMKVLFPALKSQGIDDVTLMYLDLDRFKVVNLGGHDIGDQAITDVSVIMANTAVEIEGQFEHGRVMVERDGGDELKVFIWTTDGSDPTIVSKSFAAAFAANNATRSATGAVMPSPSGGVATFSTDLPMNRLRGLINNLDDEAQKLTKQGVGFNRGGIAFFDRDQYGALTNGQVMWGPAYEGPIDPNDPSAAWRELLQVTERGPDGQTQPNVTYVDPATGEITSRPMLLNLDGLTVGDILFAAPPELLPALLAEIAKNTSPEAVQEYLDNMSRIEHNFRHLPNSQVLNAVAGMEKLQEVMQSANSVFVQVEQTSGLRDLNGPNSVAGGQSTGHEAGTRAIENSVAASFQAAEAVFGPGNFEIAKRFSAQFYLIAPNATPDQIARYNQLKGAYLNSMPLEIEVNGRMEPVLLRGADGNYHPFQPQTIYAGINVDPGQMTGNDIFDVLVRPHGNQAGLFDVIDELLKNGGDPSILQPYLDSGHELYIPPHLLPEGYDAGTKDLKGAEGSDFTVGAGGETTASFRERYGVELQTLSESSEALGGLFGLLGYKNMSATFDGVSKGVNLYLDPSVGNALSGALFAAGQFGGEKGAQVASYGGTAMAGYGAIVNPGFGSILQAATSIGGQIGVNENVLDVARGIGSVLKLASAATPAGAAVALFEVAMLLDKHLGKPNVVRLSTMIDGQEVPVEYRISANEFSYFHDPDGRAPQDFGGTIQEIDGRYFLRGAFGYDDLNPYSGEGEGALPGSIMVGDVAIQRWRPPSVMDELEVDADFAQRLLNGARQANLNLGANDPLFAMVADKLGLVQHVRYTTPADMGLMAGSNDRMLLFSHPGIPGSLSSRDYVDAHYFSPIQAGNYRFRDAQQATLFNDFGLLAAQMVAGDHALAAGFGGFDAQRILDHVGGNFDAMSGNPLFDVFAYLGANDDVRRAVGANLMQGISHWMNHGVHEGRPVMADESARNRAMAWVGGLSLFDEAAYLALNPGVAEAVARGEFANGRSHYELHGFDEGRKPFFDEAGYLARYPDVAEAVANGGVPNALHHWTHHGQFEGRDIDPAPQITASALGSNQSHAAGGFDEQAYLAANPDVAAAIANGTMDSGLGHWERHGQAEGRGFFDEQAYLAQHQGVAEAVANGTMDSALGHWERHGQHEGFGIAVSQDAPIAPVAEHTPAPEPAPAQAYSTDAYVATRPDLIAAAAAEGRDLNEYADSHFAAFGEAEGSVFA